MTIIVSILSILHGLTHLWYVTLNLRLVEVTAEMGWTGKSWLLSNLVGEGITKLLSLFLYVLATLGFLVGGVGLLLEQSWYRPLLIAGSIISILAILLFWDGVATKLVEKGLIGLLLSVGYFISVGLIGWPATLK